MDEWLELPLDFFAKPVFGKMTFILLADIESLSDLFPVEYTLLRKFYRFFGLKSVMT